MAYFDDAEKAEMSALKKYFATATTADECVYMFAGRFGDALRLCDKRNNGDVATACCVIHDLLEALNLTLLPATVENVVPIWNMVATDAIAEIGATTTLH